LKEEEEEEEEETQLRKGLSPFFLLIFLVWD